MKTYSPPKYIPFKKRICGAFIGSLILFLTLSLYYSFEFSNKSNAQAHSNSMSPEDQLLCVVFFSTMILFVIGLIIYCQVWVLDKIVIDPKSKKMRVFIRKFDTIVDKGEYDIDDNLKVKVSIKKGHTKPITAMRIKYGRKIIFSQSNSDFAGAPNWPGASFTNIHDEVENLKLLNFSSLHYKG